MLIGGNTLYPYGLMSSPALFNLEAVRGALRKLKGAGYEAVEYSHAYHLSVPEAEEAAGYARALGLAGHSVHAEGAPGFSLGKTPEEVQTALLHCLAVGAALGVRVLVVHAPCGSAHLGLPKWAQDDDVLAQRRGDAETERNVTETAGACGNPQSSLRPCVSARDIVSPPLDRVARLAKLMDADLRILEPVCLRARELGIRLALENGWSLAHMEYVLQLCDALPAGTAGICVDTGHANLGDLGPARALRLAGKRLITTHLHDNLGKVDDHLPPGEGRIDWADVFAALREIGYAGTLMLELTDGAAHRPYDQEREMRLGVENVRRMAG
jgi:sugar phosphate isomerase/epimerase